MIVFVAQMPEAFGNGLKSGAFRLTIQRIVGVCGVYNFPKKDKRWIVRQLVLFQDSLEGALFAVVA